MEKGSPMRKEREEKEEEKKEEQSVQLNQLQSQGGHGNVQSADKQLVFVVGNPPAELFENRFLSW